MTITSITKLPSGKTGATITSNLDELAILRGLVVNALRHMPDVGETTSTRQRLKAMSRALHRVYSNVSFTESTVQATPEQVAKILAMIRDCNGRVWSYSGPVRYVGGKSHKDLTISRIFNSMPEEFVKAYFLQKAELAGYSTEVCILFLQSLVDDNLVTMSPDTLKFTKTVLPTEAPQTPPGCKPRKPLQLILDGMPTTFARTQFIDEALDHGYTADEATKWLLEWLERNLKYELDAATDTVHWRGARYGGTPIIYKKPVLPVTDQRTLMECLSRMPGEFTFKYFYDLVHKTAEAYLDRQRGSGVDVESKLREECDTFLMDLPRNVFEVEGVFQSVKRNGYVAVVDPKSIPNPDYVSPAAAPIVPVTPPAGATKPTLGITGIATKRRPIGLIYSDVSSKHDHGFMQDDFVEEAVRQGWTTKEASEFLDKVHINEKRPTVTRTTLFEVYDKIDSPFMFEALRSKASEYGHDRQKVSEFVSLMCKIGSLRHEGGFLYVKLSNVRESEMRHLASLIA